MIFEKSSTRTRISFEAGMAHFGGSALFLSPRDTQLGRGEPLEDSARVISSMVDCIMLRTNSHQTVSTFAHYSRVPVINCLTDLHHPCQLLADMQTYVELRGDISGKTVVWVGDGNNMCHSYIQAAALLDFKLHIACPADYRPDAEIVARAGDHVRFFDSPDEAAKQADLSLPTCGPAWARKRNRSYGKSPLRSIKLRKTPCARRNLMRYSCTVYRPTAAKKPVLT